MRSGRTVLDRLHAYELKAGASKAALWLRWCFHSRCSAKEATNLIKSTPLRGVM